MFYNFSVIIKTKKIHRYVLYVTRPCLVTVKRHQIAFGYGPHFCMGANLARAEIRAMFDEILGRIPDIEVAGPVRRMRSTTVSSIKSLPVRFTPES